MKKYILIALFGLGIFLSPHFSLADTVIVSTTTAPASISVTTAGTITGWSSNTGGCFASCSGAGATPITVSLLVNGITVSTSTAGTGSSPATTTISGLSIPVIYGDTITEEATWPYPTNGIFGTIYGSFGSNGSFFDPALSFLFPTNGTTTPIFTDWGLAATGLNASTSYTYQVRFSQSGSGSIGTDNGTSPAGITADNIFFNSGIQFDVSQFTPSSSWTATAILIDNAIPFATGADVQPQDVASTSIAFTVLSNGTIVNTNSTSTYVVNSSTVNFVGSGITTSVNGTCAAPTSSVFADPATYTSQSLAYGLCTTSVFLLVPSSQISGFMANSVSNLENVMPFSLAYGIFQAIQNATQSSSIPAEQDIVWQMNDGSQGTVPITIIGSSTLQSAFGNTNKTLIFQWEDYFFWIITLMAMFFTVYEFIHVIAGHKPKTHRK